MDQSLDQILLSIRTHKLSPDEVDWGAHTNMFSPDKLRFIIKYIGRDNARRVADAIISAWHRFVDLNYNDHLLLGWHMALCGREPWHNSLTPTPKEGVSNLSFDKIEDFLADCIASYYGANPAPKPQQLLFADEATQQAMAQEFLALLTAKGISHEQFDSSPKSPVNTAILEMLHEWQGRKILNRDINVEAVFRFLTVSCSLKCKVKGRTWPNRMRDLIR